MEETTGTLKIFSAAIDVFNNWDKTSNEVKNEKMYVAINELSELFKLPMSMCFLNKDNFVEALILDKQHMFEFIWAARKVLEYSKLDIDYKVIIKKFLRLWEQRIMKTEQMYLMI